jgi:hypothetical protein
VDVVGELGSTHFVEARTKGPNQRIHEERVNPFALVSNRQFKVDIIVCEAKLGNFLNLLLAGRFYFHIFIEGVYPDRLYVFSGLILSESNYIVDQILQVIIHGDLRCV